MKFSSVAPLLAAVPGTLGAALPLAARGQDAALITFIGAADAQFTQDFPKDGSAVTISTYHYAYSVTCLTKSPSQPPKHLSHLLQQPRRHLYLHRHRRQLNHHQRCCIRRRRPSPDSGPGILQADLAP